MNYYLNAMKFAAKQIDDHYDRLDFIIAIIANNEEMLHEDWPEFFDFLKECENGQSA